MARPRNEHPTPTELEVLKILWEQGPATVRDIHEAFTGMQRERAYTSVMSLMNVMADKGFLRRVPHGRAFLYEPCIQREEALQQLLGDLWQRAYEGSATLLVSQLLEQANPDRDELNEIRRVIEQYRKHNVEDRR